MLAAGIKKSLTSISRCVPISLGKSGKRRKETPTQAQPPKKWVFGCILPLLLTRSPPARPPPRKKTKTHPINTVESSNFLPTKAKRIRNSLEVSKKADFGTRETFGSS